MATAEELEGKIQAIISRLADYRKDNQRLHLEIDSLKGHIALLTGENGKAQRILAEYEQIKRKQDQVTHRVERALNTLNALRTV